MPQLSDKTFVKFSIKDSDSVFGYAVNPPRKLI